MPQRVAAGRGLPYSTSQRSERAYDATWRNLQSCIGLGRGCWCWALLGQDFGRGVTYLATELLRNRLHALCSPPFCRPSPSPTLQHTWIAGLLALGLRCMSLLSRQTGSRASPSNGWGVASSAAGNALDGFGPTAPPLRQVFFAPHAPQRQYELKSSLSGFLQRRSP